MTMSRLSTTATIFALLLSLPGCGQPAENDGTDSPPSDEPTAQAQQALTSSGFEISIYNNTGAIAGIFNPADPAHPNRSKAMVAPFYNWNYLQDPRYGSGFVYIYGNTCLKVYNTGKVSLRDYETGSSGFHIVNGHKYRADYDHWFFYGLKLTDTTSGEWVHVMAPTPRLPSGSCG
ncbi:MAG: hypothetical protein JNJ46_27885 [Myxococcales bacterium]|jgi:hypothetical protein|nr:hypothetical protein [Myxococcales bacterium]